MSIIRTVFESVEINLSENSCANTVDTSNLDKVYVSCERSKSTGGVSSSIKIYHTTGNHVPTVVFS